MTPALSSAAMREADRLTIEEFGIPGRTLMEAAGREAVRLLLDQVGGKKSTFGIVCGKGNNGGDGLVAARHLADAGFRVLVHLAGGDQGLSPDAAANLELVRRMPGGNPQTVDALGDLSEAHVLVDALLGTGMESPPRAPLQECIDWMNACAKPIAALDIPTGLHADTGAPLGRPVRASWTITMGAPKTGLLLGEGPDHAGRVIVASIGIPRHILEGRVDNTGSAWICDDAFVRATLPRRRRGSHKYESGPAVVVGGSAKYPGAPALSSAAAARAGAGYVVTSLPQGVDPMGPAEIPVVHHGSADESEWLDRARSVLVGPGLGKGEGARRCVEAVVQAAGCPVVIDADGLGALAALNRLPGPGNWILTPHAGEFSRLAGGEADPRNPVDSARHWAAAWNVVLVLKGAPTVVASPDGRVVICPLGGPELGTAGTGDVLSGMCAGLVAAGVDLFEAAVCATHMGGAASERWTTQRGTSSMMASDIIAQLPLVLSERFSN